MIVLAHGSTVFFLRGADFFLAAFVSAAGLREVFFAGFRADFSGLGSWFPTHSAEERGMDGAPAGLLEEVTAGPSIRCARSG